jgi:hypothetical protein
MSAAHQAAIEASEGTLDGPSVSQNVPAGPSDNPTLLSFQESTQGTHVLKLFY